MSNHPEGTPLLYRTTIDYKCDNCGEEWEAPAIMEAGIYRLNNPDSDICPGCGEEAD